MDPDAIPILIVIGVVFVVALALLAWPTERR